MTSPIILKNNTSQAIDLDIRGFVLPASGVETITDYLTPIEIEQSEPLILNVSSTAITVNNGEEDLSPTEGVKLCLGKFDSVTLLDEYRDISGKLRVHQTSRKLGLRICWTGEGDDPENPKAIGGGNKISYYHTVSGTDPSTKYIDFNCVENETWVHEGYITWKDAQLDELTLEVVTRTVDITVASGTSYDVYGGYLIVPNPYGTGTIDVLSDITTHSGGLVYMPDNDLGEPPTAYWNADWNPVTEKYENITMAPFGNGRYNMFATEITLTRILNKIPLLHSGFIAMNSSDTDRIGHGMRFKVTLDTNNTLSDFHEWSMASVLCMHREKSI